MNVLRDHYDHGILSKCIRSLDCLALCNSTDTLNHHTRFREQSELLQKGSASKKVGKH